MIHTISLGAGVQSSTMALMATQGEITPMPEAAVFADTQAEPESVYRWLEWLETELAFPVVRVTKGNLTETALKMRTRKNGAGQWTKSLIPVYTIDESGKKGHMQRACTYDYKLTQLLKAQRKIGGIKRGQKTVGVTAWIGMSMDEIERMKPSREPWVVNRWPLIEMGMTRQDCLDWMGKNGYPRPPRSACVYCPFHSDVEWNRLKTEEPQEFERAVQFERDLQRTKAMTDNMRSTPFLHVARIPLDQINFSASVDKFDPFQYECEGLCGV